MTALDATWISHSLWVQLGLTLTHFLWQGAVIAGALAVVLRYLRRRSANARYAACGAALFLMATCPVITLVYVRASYVPQITPDHACLTPGARSPEMTMGDWSRMAAQAPDTPLSAHRANEPASRRIDATASTHEHRARRTWLTPALAMAAYAWCTCVMVLGLRLIAGWASLRRLRFRDTEPLPAQLRAIVKRVSDRLGIGSRINVLATARLLEPVALGLVRPVVLLPVSLMTHCPPELIEAVIAHELAHIRRYDLWVNLFQRVIETLLFYHPAIWWVSSRMRLERELCCDDLAVASTRRRARYAEALLAISQARAANVSRAWAMGMFSHRMTLLSRVRRVLQLQVSPQQDRFWLAGPVSLLLAGSLILVTQIHAADAQPPASQDTPGAVATDVTAPAEPDANAPADTTEKAKTANHNAPSPERAEEPGTTLRDLYNNLTTKLQAHEKQARAHARPLIDAGNQAAARGQYDLAQKKLTEALKVLPRHPAALDSLERIQQRRAVEKQPNLLETADARRQAIWTRTVHLLSENEKQIRNLINEHDYDDARMRLIDSEQLLESARAHAPTGNDYVSMSNRLVSLGRFIDSDELQYRKAEAFLHRKEALAEARERQQNQDKERLDRLATLVEQAQHFIRQEQYEKAADLLREALDSDLAQNNVSYRLEEIQDARLIQRQKEDRTRFNDLIVQGLMEARSAIAPPVTADPDKPLAYPDKEQWQRIVERTSASAGSGVSAEDRQAQTALSIRLPDENLEFPQGTTFREVLDELERAGKCSLNVRWSKLNEAFVVPDDTILTDLDYNGEILVNALRDLLDNIEGATGTKLDFQVDDGRIVISTVEDLNSPENTRLVTFSVGKALQALREPTKREPSETFDILGDSSGYERGMGFNRGFGGDRGMMGNYGYPGRGMFGGSQFGGSRFGPTGYSGGYSGTMRGGYSGYSGGGYGGSYGGGGYGGTGYRFGY